MKKQIRKIYLSIEKEFGPKDINFDDDHTDVIIEMQDGNHYVASFFTFKNLDTIRNRIRNNPNFLDGKFFWVDHMIFIRDIRIETIREVIQFLMEEGDFDKVFSQL